MFIKRKHLGEKLQSEDFDQPKSPEQNLLIALLRRKVMDAAGATDVGAPDYRSVHYRNAQAWLRLDRPLTKKDFTDPTPWSFSWVAQNLDLDLLYTHKTIKRRVQEINKERKDGTFVFFKCRLPY